MFFLSLLAEVSFWPTIIQVMAYFGATLQAFLPSNYKSNFWEQVSDNLCKTRNCKYVTHVAIVLVSIHSDIANQSWQFSCLLYLALNSFSTQPPIGRHSN